MFTPLQGPTDKQRRAAQSSSERDGLRQTADRILDRRIRAVLALVHSRHGCSVRELAREVNLSSDHLQRLFKQEIGVPISDYQAEQRLQKAAQLLTSSDMSIKEIAFAVGYEHHSSFTRAFENRFSRSPKVYRQCADTASC